ncbi:hypothetical protein V8017_18595 [Stenotrophomonas rhizophila]
MRRCADDGHQWPLLRAPDRRESRRAAGRVGVRHGTSSRTQWSGRSRTVAAPGGLHHPALRHPVVV